jgi:hypothetical protein
MCEKCDQLTQKLNHYERLRVGGFDDLTVQRIELLMDDMRAERAGMHSQERRCS